MSDRRRGIDKPKPLSLTGLGGWIVLAAILFLGANYGLNAGLQRLDTTPVREHLKAAFASGELGIINSRGGDADMGVHQTNDCLIFDMAARNGDGNPLYLFAGARTGAAREESAGNCELLRDWLNQDPTQRFWEVWYLRYIHGYRAVAIVLLDNFSVVQTRALLKAASYGVLLLALALNLHFAARRRGGGVHAAASSSAAGFALIAASLLGFFGLPYFGQSISHAPAICTLGGFIILWSALDHFGRLTERTGLFAIIGFALFTAYFEYLTGYIPIGSCVIMALVSISWGGRPSAASWSMLRFLVVCEAAFISTIIVVFALHTLATALADKAGMEIVTLFLDRLSSRMAQTVPTDAQADIRVITSLDLLSALHKQLGHLGIWSQRTAATIILGSIGVSAFVVYDMLFVPRDARHRFSAALAAGSFLPVLVWVLAFQNHTTVHAAFMVRILAALPMAGVLAAWSWYRVVISAPSTIAQPMRASARDGPTAPSMATS